MMNKYTGGPAFPFQCQGRTTAPEIYYGMTLRDYFAAKAMQGFISAGCGVARSADHWAAMSYAQADAMMKAREQ